MSVSYSRLWKLLIDKNMNKSQLRDAAGISTNAVAKLGRNEAVSLDTLEKVCCALDCNIEDVLEFVKVSEVFPHDHS
jgi:DNA (cytosine-5)-methyltransferase 1